MRKQNYCIDCGVTISPQAKRCSQCAPKDPVRRRSVSEKMKKDWESHPERRAETSQRMQRHKQEWWKDPENKERARNIVTKHWADNPERRESTSKRSKDNWKNPEYRSAVTSAAIERYKDQKWHKITGDALFEKWKDPEFRKKHAEAFNPFFIHGQGERHYSRGFTERKRNEVRTRDHFTCRLCGLSNKITLLNVHHIDFSKDNHDNSNLICLCNICHGLAHTHSEKETIRLLLQQVVTDGLATSQGSNKDEGGDSCVIRPFL